MTRNIIPTKETQMDSLDKIHAEHYFQEALWHKGVKWILTYDEKENYLLLLKLWFGLWECNKHNYSCLNALMQYCWKEFVYLLTGEKGTKIKDE